MKIFFINFQSNVTFHAVRVSTPTLGLAAAQVGIALGCQTSGWGECKSIYVKASFLELLISHDHVFFVI